MNLFIIHLWSVVSCNAIDDPFTRICLPDKVKNMNGKVFNLMSGVDETRFLLQHELCKCKFRLNENVFRAKMES